MSTYLILNLAAVFLPLVLSFEKKNIFFAGKWKYLFPSIVLTGIVFLAWDVLFTSAGIWGFNPGHLAGISLFGLPLEEWLFFITVPYACLFTYEAVKKLIKKDILQNASRYISWLLIAVLLVTGLVFRQRAYTSVTFLAAGVLLIIHMVYIREDYLGRFYLAYFFCLLPFLIMNGILTGTLIEEEVVWYNDSENLGLRILTIPLEDTVYGMMLILMNVTFYEWFRKLY